MSLERIFLDGHRVDGFWIDPSSKIIQFLKKIGGESVKFSTKIRIEGSEPSAGEINKAKKMANQELQKILGQKKKSHFQSLIKDEFFGYLKIKEAEGLDYRTIQKIRQAEKKIIPFWGSMLPSEINRDSAAEWINWLSEKYPGKQKFNSIKYMRNFSKYLSEKGLLSFVPRIVDPDAKRFEMLRAKKKERTFTSDEFKKVYQNAPSDRERRVAMFMYAMGTRIEETLGLRLGDEIRRVNGQWIYQWSIGQNKADHAGWHALHPAVEAIIIKSGAPIVGPGSFSLLFPQQRDPTKALKPQQIDWDGWREKANLGWHWTSHTFRHTCLTNLFNDSKNPQALICKLYRVSLAVALAVYVKPTKEGIERMKNAIEINL